MHNPIQVVTVNNVFTKEQCEAMIAEYKPSLEPGLIEVEKEAKLETQIRRCSCYYVFPDASNAALFERLGGMIKRVNDEFYKFELDSFKEGVQFTEYKVDEFFKWHTDCGPGILMERKLSLTVQLSDPTDYTGGELELWDHTATLDQGSATIFPSFMQHKVDPIIEGTRYALVSWVAGPTFR
jgi:PKHD-type hydroxylase